mmetsp:Transcript_6045/g.9641  ORF Transcript_6045/g.9641 Transcript_6045/m.9641 type:complete len:254 (+) Transcript_6045:71-832(+)|eukprot:CAMPEP_0184303732 /NCGR_PEP_ID=MMETSP1049-20130417/13426_1 /TAXON_ID=77928 /ORGANISM="Proteomonas sulcata, Strain CCMP704" /LENGTH=253 /DNA_ID=CAMNT_0026615367 /DNA_START=1 /DNA_END=762 /DNA_ORIENTATION=+
MFIPPTLTGIEAVVCAGSDASSTAAVTSTSAHTSSLSAADAQWHSSYSWYPDTPGQYPASKWAWYHGTPGQWEGKWSWYHGPASTAGDASTATLAGTASANTTALSAPDQVWTNSYSWYPDTPGAYPESKMTWYYNSGGLYDQAHQVAVIPPATADVAENRVKTATKPVPASPGHLLLCGNALVFGLLDATCKIFEEKDKDAVEAWKEDFACSARAAAAAASPVGGVLMSEHILKESQVPEIETLGRVVEDEE